MNSLTRNRAVVTKCQYLCPDNPIRDHFVCITSVLDRVVRRRGAIELKRAVCTIERLVQMAADHGTYMRARSQR